MKVNKAWHEDNVMPSNPSKMDRVLWHAEHEEACGCRPVPTSLAADVRALKRKKAERPE